MTVILAYTLIVMLAPPSARASAQPGSDVTVHALSQPSGVYGDTLSFELTGYSPLVATTNGRQMLTVTGHYTNTGDYPVTDLGYRFQRGDAITGDKAITDIADDPGQPTAVITDTFNDLPGALAPGEGEDFIATIPITGDTATSLAVTTPGIYPVMININAAVELDGGSLRARVGELHLLLPVASAPNTHGTTPTHPATPITMFYPLVSKPHLAVGDVFANDALAADIAPGGRIRTLVEALRNSGAPHDAVTIVIDPMLIDELHRMADGYQVLADPNSSQGALQPGNTADIATVTGSGSVAASEVLGVIRDLTSHYATVALPYGDPDVSALTRSGMTSDIATAQKKGEQVMRSILGTTGTTIGPGWWGSGQSTATLDELITTVAYPADGTITPTAWTALQRLGYTATVVQPDGIDTPHKTSGLVTLTDGKDAGKAIVAGGALRKDLIDIITTGADDDWSHTANLLASLATNNYLGKADNPLILAPDRHWSVNKRGLARISSLVRSLGTAGVMTSTRVSSYLRDAGSPDQKPAVTGTLNYPNEAKQAELGHTYLTTVHGLHQKVDALRMSVTAADPTDDTPNPPNPTDIFDPLTAALLGATSTSWRGDQHPDLAVLGTVAATITWLYNGVSIVRSSSSYTLASSTAPLLLNVRNTLPYKVSARIDIVGGAQAGLETTNNDPIVIPAGPRTVPIKLATHVSRSGTFTVYAQLRGADDAEWGTPVRLTINSHAYGILTLILMLVAGGLLLVMVVFRIRQRWRDHRKGRRKHPTVGTA